MHPHIAAAIRERTPQEVERIDQLTLDHIGKALRDCTPEDLDVVAAQLRDEQTLLRHELEFAEDALNGVLDRIEERWRIEGR